MGGSILYKGRDLKDLIRHDQMWYRGQIQTIFQDASNSLNPPMRIQEIVSEPLEI